MKFISTLAIALVASSEAFAPVPSSSPSSTALRAEIGETGVAFENVAREWRCKVCSFGNYLSNGSKFTGRIQGLNWQQLPMRSAGSVKIHVTHTTRLFSSSILSANSNNFESDSQKLKQMWNTVLPWTIWWTRRLRKSQGLSGIVGRIPSSVEGTSRSHHHSPGMRRMFGFQGFHLAAIGRTRCLGWRRLPAPRRGIHGKAQGHWGNFCPRDTGNHLWDSVKNNIQSLHNITSIGLHSFNFFNILLINIF